MEMDKLLRIETTTQSVSNRSSHLYYTTFLVFSKINITKFQKINISKKKIKEIGLTQIKKPSIHHGRAAFRKLGMTSSF